MNQITITIETTTYTLTALNSTGMGRLARWLCNGWYTDEQVFDLAMQFPNDIEIATSAKG